MLSGGNLNLEKVQYAAVLDDGLTVLHVIAIDLCWQSFRCLSVFIQMHAQACTRMHTHAYTHAAEPAALIKSGLLWSNALC